MYKIYTLTCPIDNVVRYVGVTTVKDIKDKLTYHYSTRDGTHEKLIWMAKLKFNKLKPIINVIHEFETQDNHQGWVDALNVEKSFIIKFKEEGYDLYNGMHFVENRRKGISPSKYYEIYRKRNKEFEKQLKKYQS